MHKFQVLAKTDLQALNHFALSQNLDCTAMLPLFLQLCAWAAIASTIQHSLL